MAAFTPALNLLHKGVNDCTRCRSMVNWTLKGMWTIHSYLYNPSTDFRRVECSASLKNAWYFSFQFCCHYFLFHIPHF